MPCATGWMIRLWRWRKLSGDHRRCGRNWTARWKGWKSGWTMLPSSSRSSSRQMTLRSSSWQMTLRSSSRQMTLRSSSKQLSISSSCTGACQQPWQAKEQEDQKQATPEQASLQCSSSRWTRTGTQRSQHKQRSQRSPQRRRQHRAGLPRRQRFSCNSSRTTCRNLVIGMPQRFTLCMFLG